MSALGQKQTCAAQQVMSALRPTADIGAAQGMSAKCQKRDGIQYVEHAEGHGDRMFVAACDLGLEGIVQRS